MKTAAKAAENAAPRGMDEATIQSFLRELIDNPRHMSMPPTSAHWRSALEKHAKIKDASHPARPAPIGVGDRTWMTRPLSKWNIPAKCLFPFGGTLMPDAPWATDFPSVALFAVKEAVIPYAVGMDIACRMKMTVLDLPVTTLDREREFLFGPLKKKPNSASGRLSKTAGTSGHGRRLAFLPTPVHHRDKAWAQRGTSCSWQSFRGIWSPRMAAGMIWACPTGRYLALLVTAAQSRRRGPSRHLLQQIAMNQHPELPGISCSNRGLNSKAPKVGNIGRPWN
jgi:tRNA-splicing ligase RtcB